MPRAVRNVQSVVITTLDLRYAEVAEILKKHFGMEGVARIEADTLNDFIQITTSVTSTETKFVNLPESEA